MKGIKFMRIYEMIDGDRKASVGVLLYYEKKKDFIIELREDLDEWTAPLLFSGLVKKKIFTVPRELGLIWVRERIIPNGRQNISMILKNHRMEAYDEMKFLELSKGICCQDGLFIRKKKQLPEYAFERRNKNVTDCVACDDRRLLCCFMDDTMKMIDLKRLTDVDGVDKIMKNDRLYQSCKIGTGGYFVTFDDSIDLSSRLLYEAGINLPLSRKDLMCFAVNNLVDTMEACQELACSRQNISHMLKQGKLKPVKENVRGNLYLKADVTANTW